MQGTRRFATAMVITMIAGGLTAGTATAAVAASTAPTVAPTLVAPTYNTPVGGNPVLQWTAVPSAVRYRVQVATSASFGTILYTVDTVGLRATPTTDLPLGSLYWRVAGTDGGSGVGPYAASQFVKQAVAGPALVSPVDDAVLAYPTELPVLRWSALTGMKTYRVELDDADDFVGAQVFTTAGTSLALTEPVILDKAYYWRVQGVSATTGVTGAYSEIRSFRSTWPTPSGQPTLLAPANDVVAEVTDVVFRWQAVSGAKSYQIQVSPNQEFAGNITDDQVVRGTQYSPSATYDNANYYWRVRALDTGTAQHQGPWSAVWQFRRAWTVAPVALSPIGDVTVSTPRFEWSGVAHASQYELQVSDDPGFALVEGWCMTFNTTVTPYHRFTGIGQSTTYPNTPTGADCDFSLDLGVRYYWRVRGVDMPSAVYSLYSTPASFILDRGAPTMTGAADGGTTTSPVLAWDSTGGYVKYRVTLIKPSGAQVVATTYSTSYTPTSTLSPGNYSWYVVGIDANDQLGSAPLASGYGHFTLVAPTGTASMDATSVTTMDGGVKMPSLSWQPLTGATKYEVFAQPAAGGALVSLTGSAGTPFTSYTATAETLASGAYNWFVEAFDTNGLHLGFSQTGSFTVADTDFTTYRSPEHCGLANCPTIEPTTPELRWYPVTGAGSYIVWTAQDPNFTNIVRKYSTSQTSLTPREAYLDNTAGQSYYWFVQPCKSLNRCGVFGGQSLLDHERAFRKLTPAAVPTTPDDLLVPAHTDVVSFAWQDYFDTSAGKVAAKSYRFQVAIDSAFNTIVDSVTVDQPAYQAWAKSYPDNVYYWRVQAVDGSDTLLTASAPRQFRRTSQVPTPVATSSTVGLPTLTWNALTYASGYTVDVFRGTDATFPAANRVLSATTKLPVFTPTATLPAGTYSWRVRKLNPDGNSGPWSTSVPTFTVGQPAPTLSSPADAAKFLTNNLGFTWLAVAGASSYLFESSASAGFASTVEQVSTVMTTWVPTVGYPDRATYYWRVRVLDGDGNVLATSAVRRFDKDAVAPTVTAVSPTTALAVNGPVTVTFSEPVKGLAAAGFALRVAGTSTAVAGTVPVSASTVASTVTFQPSTPLLPGQYYDLTVGTGITDVIGNALVPTTTRLRTATTMENTTAGLTELWDTDAATGASGGAYLSASTAGATATFRFTGTAVSVLGRVSPTGGTADVLIDGVKINTTPVSFYAATPAFGRTMISKTGLTNAAHTLVVRVLGGRPTGSTGTAVELDAFVAGSTYQENNAAVSTAFARVANTGANGGSYDAVGQPDVDTTGAEYRFGFRGTGFSLTATQLPDGGTATVYVDGVNMGTVKFYATTARYRTTVFTSATLADAVHTVRLVATGAVPTGSTGTTVTLDSVTIR